MAGLTCMMERVRADAAQAPNRRMVTRTPAIMPRRAIARFANCEHEALPVRTR